MRRLLSLPLSLVAAATLVMTPALVGTSAAASAKDGRSGQGQAQSQDAKRDAAKPKPTKKPQPTKKPKASQKPKPSKADKSKKKVVVVGVVSDTRTVTTSGTSTVLITVKVQGGDKEYKGKTVQVTVDKNTVVKRNHGKKTRYELRRGDKVTIHARRDAAGRLTAAYVAASGRGAAKPAKPVPSSTNTATTTAGTEPAK